MENAMDFLIPFGVDFVVFIQGLGAWLEAPMKFFTFLGSQEFFFLVFPALYWCIDSALGLQVAYMLMAESAVIDLAKFSFAAPRPYWVSERVTAFLGEGSFGIPSGHAGRAVALWGPIAARLRQDWARAAALALIFLIGFSRLYLGVHFLHDVLLGWILGVLVLWLLLAQWVRLSDWLKSQSFGRQIGLALAVSLAYPLIAALVVRAHAGWELDPAWIPNILRAGPELPEPLALGGVVTIAGLFFGFSLGLAWMERRGGFRASGPVVKRVLCYVLGVFGVGILWFGLGQVLPRGEELVPQILRWLRYALVGAWVTGGAPWLFFRLKLVS
jgi:membrane-associated phospholipid phosphatase